MNTFPSLQRPLRLTLFVIFATLAAASHAEDIPLDFEGEGTAGSPYLLKSGTDIMELAAACAGQAGATSGTSAPHYAGVHFALANDIDMAGITGFYGIGAAPLGSSSGISWHFDGIIDGRGHTVSNMRIEGIFYDENGTALAASKTGTRSYVGFIGTLGQGGMVKDLYFDSTCYVGGCTSTGTVAGQANGGSSITGCTSAATVENLKKNSGGIVGNVNGSTTTVTTVSQCVFTGTVRECTEAVAGIAGRAVRATVTGCVNLGNVEARSFNSFALPGKQNQGAGIVGYSQYTVVENCMNAGPVTVSYQKAGGIVAYNANLDATVKNCVNLGPVQSPDNLYKGAVVGHNYKSSTKYGVVSGCYYDTQLWGALPGYQVPEGCVIPMQTAAFTDGFPLEGLAGENWIYENGFYPRPAIQLAIQHIKEAAATYVLFQPGQSASDFITTATVSTAMPGITATMQSGEWFTVDGGTIRAGSPDEAVSDTVNLANGLYRLSIPVTKVPVSFQGSGTENDPYLISTPLHLQTLAERCNSDRMEHYENIWFLQTADIDMCGDKTFKGIASKNTNAFNSELSYYFSGHYNGNNHSISNLDIEGVVFLPDGRAAGYTQGSTGNVGLFGALGEGASVKNLSVISSSVSGYYNVGAIAGFLHDGASVDSCRVENTTVIAYNRNAGGIAGATAMVTGEGTGPVVSNCFFSGSVKANSENAGGIIGQNCGKVSGCFNAAGISVGKFNDCEETPKNVNAGGITGYNCGDISGCLNLGDVSSAWSQAGGIAGGNTNGYRKGNIYSNVSAGQISAPDHTYAGSLLGLDYRLTTSSSSEMNLTGNWYDSQASALGGSGNSDKDGFTGALTSDLTSGTSLEGISSGWILHNGFYPLPVAFSGYAPAEECTGLYVMPELPYALYNFGLSAPVSTVLPVNVSLEPSSGCFFYSDGNIHAAMPDSIARAVVSLSSANASRSLDLTKAGKLLPGDGTSESPYLISTPDEFNKVGTFLRDNRYGFQGIWFKVTADLDFTDVGFVPIGNQGTHFNGVFNGNGNVLTGISADTSEDENVAGTGMFPYLGQYGGLENIEAHVGFRGESVVGGISGHCLGKISNCSLHGEIAAVSKEGGPSNSGNEAGGIAARVYPTAIIENCANHASVSANKMAGGILGAARDETGCRVSGCTNSGSVTATAPRETIIQGGQQVSNFVEAMAGGIAGRFTGVVEGCANSGSVSTALCDAAGGIVGKAFIHAEISDCINNGTVNTANCYGGGIVGITTVTSGDDIHTLIKGCANYAPVTGISSLGGIAGVAANGCWIDSCCNRSEIKPMMGRAGGIVGEVSKKVSVTRSWNSGDISASMLAAGIAGDVPSGGILNIGTCFNTGDITTGNNGGSAGIVNSTAGETTVTECYNAGAITGARHLGGISGRSDNSVMTRCFSTGEITCTSPNPSFVATVGYMAGSNESLTATGCCFLMRPAEWAGDAGTAGISPMTAASMFACDDVLGNGYVYADICFPRLSQFADLPEAKVNSVYFLLEGESEDEISSEFPLGLLNGIVWTSEGALSVKNGDTAIPTEAGEASLTASCTSGEDNVSKTFSFTVVDSGVAALEQSVKESIYRYYDLNGREVNRPVHGQILLQVPRDGTSGKPVLVRVK